MFDNMEISEANYEGVVEPSYKNKTTISYANHAGISTKMISGATPLNIYSRMSFHAGNFKQRYVDCLKD